MGATLDQQLGFIPDAATMDDVGFVPDAVQPAGNRPGSAARMAPFKLDPYEETLATGANREMDADPDSFLRGIVNDPSLGISPDKPWTLALAPFKAAGRVVATPLNYTGNILRALPLDIAEGWDGQNVYGTPFENMAAAALGERVLPADPQLQAGEAENPLAGSLANISQGITESVPKMMAVAAMPASLPMQMAGGGALFGLDDDGNFNLKNAATAALLPGVGVAARAVVKGAIAKGIQAGLGGLNKPVVQKALTVGGEQAALNAYQLATQAPQLAQLYRTDPKQFWANLGMTIGQNAAFAATHLSDSSEVPGSISDENQPVSVTAVNRAFPESEHSSEYPLGKGDLLADNKPPQPASEPQDRVTRGIPEVPGAQPASEGSSDAPLLPQPTGSPTAGGLGLGFIPDIDPALPASAADQSDDAIGVESGPDDVSSGWEGIGAAAPSVGLDLGFVPDVAEIPEQPAPLQNSVESPAQTPLEAKLANVKAAVTDLEAAVKGVQPGPGPVAAEPASPEPNPSEYPVPVSRPDTGGEVALAPVVANINGEGVNAAGSQSETKLPKNGNNASQTAEANVKSSPETDWRRIWLERIRAGIEFNKAQRARYKYNELYVDGGGTYYRLDSYNHETGEIVSRKFTELSRIKAETAIKYIRELVNKYPPGTVIAEVPSNGELGGLTLRGQMILEIPPQEKPIPQAVLDEAAKAGVIIRDIEGKQY